MFVKTAAVTSQLCLRRIRKLSTLALLNKEFAVKSRTPLKANQLNANLYCTKFPVHVLPSYYDEVKDLPNHPEKLLIDVREPDELKEFGVIPTSINIPLGSVSKELSSSVRDDVFKAKYGREKPKENTEIIFHCRLGKRSAKAAETAVALGYTNVRNYEGSWIDWAEHEGLPNMDEEEPKKGPFLFGRDISQIPCFRSSFLYGIGGGIGVGIVSFLATSRPLLSSHIGFGTFCCGTVGYWMFCRYNWSKRRFEYQQLQAAMKKQAQYEGTDMEKELFKDA